MAMIAIAAVWTSTLPRFCVVKNTGESCAKRIISRTNTNNGPVLRSASTVPNVRSLAVLAVASSASTVADSPSGCVCGTVSLLTEWERL